MRFTLTLCVGLLLAAAGRASAADATYTQVTVEQLNRAVPAAAAPGYCSAPKAAGECATNSQAAAAITNAMARYGVRRRGEVVALVALMALESGDWMYNTNHFPGRPGQGTRAMLMYPYTYAYAKALHPADTPLAAEGSTDPAVMNQVRGRVLGDDDSFGAAFWYLVHSAPQYHSDPSKLRDGNLDDFKDYVVNGVGGAWSQERENAWNLVNAGL